MMEKYFYIRVLAQQRFTVNWCDATAAAHSYAAGTKKILSLKVWLKTNTLNI
jgi:hypothetical protein